MIREVKNKTIKIIRSFLNRAGIELSYLIERDTGIEPVSSPWEGDIKPLN